MDCLGNRPHHTICGGTLYPPSQLQASRRTIARKTFPGSRLQPQGPRDRRPCRGKEDQDAGRLRGPRWRYEHRNRKLALTSWRAYISSSSRCLAMFRSRSYGSVARDIACMSWEVSPAPKDGSADIPAFAEGRRGGTHATEQLRVRLAGTKRGAKREDKGVGCGRGQGPHVAHPPPRA